MSFTPKAPSSGLYLDANASEPVRPEALEAMVEGAEITGNPSSLHRAGRAARAALDHSRRLVAERFGASAENCVFTSGGTEANLLAVRGLGAGRTLLVGATEHDAIRRALDDSTLCTIPVLRDGTLDLEVLEARLSEVGQHGALVCAMLANNETGVLHPMSEITSLCRRYGARLHVDAVQAAGRLTFDLGSLGADSLAISGHKFGGPKGAGALLLAGEGAVSLAPVQAGGGQERGRRGGTPALPAIMGMAAALDAASTRPRDLAPLRDAIEIAARAVGATVCGDGTPRLGNTTSLALSGIRSESQLIALDLDGVCVSAGSACSSGKVATSHVLEAMGLGDLAGCAVRVSLPWNTPDDCAEIFNAAYARLVSRRRRDG
ncbi:cysteine desulfurase family protein [Acetobacter sp. DsW_063]|uniref:cysteine desulfurase family protein n=1 Tax=Acetobacter sp. DsW_063 TaxID=1514894 RepID=UPI000A3812CB|nr:aminotransferase class V-fold PLP-dependent enzyme [Acetobacter sp. DsW_063]OUJ14925.1 cysteine desulfurase [Acetobacter sp. DsW_063]